MERRLQKDFQIGIVEGIVQAVIQSEKEPKDVFSQIARAIGRKGSSAGKKDWNAVVRQSTIAMDPIGSTNEAMQRQTRRSLRRQLRHQPNSDLASMDPKRLLEYNPNLSDFTPVTRIAYAKFMLSKNKPDEQPDDTSDHSNETTKVTEEASQRSSKVMIAETSTDMIPRPAIETFKKSLLKSASSSSSSMDKPVILDIKGIEIRSPSPIPEDPIGEEISKQSSIMSDKEKTEKKENTQEQKDGEVSEKKTLKEQKEEEIKVENKRQQSSVERNNSDNTRQMTSETNKEINIEKCAESDAKERKSEVPAVQTTKLQGKSKATGQMMGGWI